MSDPVTASMAIMAVGTAVSAYSQIRSANEKAEAMELEAKLQREKAAQSLMSAQRDSEITAAKGEAAASGMAASFAEGGVDVGSGTPLLLLTKALVDSRNDAAAIMQAGQFGSYVSNMQAGANEYLAASTRTSGYINAGATLLGGAGQAYPYFRNSAPSTGQSVGGSMGSSYGGGIQ